MEFAICTKALKGMVALQPPSVAFATAALEDDPEAVDAPAEVPAEVPVEVPAALVPKFNKVDPVVDPARAVIPDVIDPLVIGPRPRRFPRLAIELTEKSGMP